MNKTRKEILDEQYRKFIIEKGISSVSSKCFPKQYEEPVLAAMKICGEQEARSFANWLSYQKADNRTLDQLWKDYQEAIS
ncbi:MAG: hypothetical protein PHT07_15510 [Paludibacter sp.]|nr:hypothetical protein [Paludibacter sp.]